MRPKLVRLLMIVVLALSSLPVMSAAPSVAQTQPCSQEAGPAGCIDLVLNPATLVGDVLVDGQPVAGQVNTARLSVAPNVPHVIEVNNINDSTPGFNDLFNYNPASQKNVVVAAGRTRTLTLKPLINYLKGYVKFTCDVKGLEAGQAVACQPNVDGNALPAVNPGETQQFAIPNGDHTFHVDLVGPNVDLWAPPATEAKIKIAGNRTTLLRSTFNRKGQLVLGIKLPGVVGDLFVDGQPIGGQVPNASIFVAPGSHKVEGRNFVDPAANGVYHWLDVVMTSLVGANQTRSVTLIPRKEFLLGFANVTCRINGFEAGRDVRCNVAVDGQGLGAIEVGQNQTYNLPPGPHTLNVSVVGGNADLWAPPAQDIPIKITAGLTNRSNPTFNRKGIFNITLSDPNVVADIFVDGVQVAGQVNSTQFAVAPNVRHTLEARSLRNVTTPDAFEYDNISTVATVFANQTRPATLKVGKPRERCTGGMALVTVYNRLRSTLMLKFVGPETFTIRISASGTAPICIVPGTYAITSTAPGYHTETATHDVQSGGCYWYQIYNKNEQPPEATCSPNIGDYHRPSTYQ